MTAKTDIKTLIRESHDRQFNGEDWQYVAQGIAESNGIAYGSEEYNALTTAPEEGCECGFCASAPWID